MSNEKSTSPSQTHSLKSTQPKPISMSEYQQKKDQQLKNLHRRSIQDEKIRQSMEKQTREEQIARARKQTAGNPLAFDEYRFYEQNMTRLRKKYLAQRYSPPKKAKQ